MEYRRLKDIDTFTVIGLKTVLKDIAKWIYYSLDDEHIKKIFDMGFEHITKG
jgi:hypothetical protein